MSDQHSNHGAPLPPRPEKRFFLVVSPKGDIKLPVIFLAKTFTGFWTHWQGRPVPCYENAGCVHCQAGLGHRWTGYIAGYHCVLKKHVVVALSEGAARQAAALMKTPTGLRGVQVDMVRKKKEPNAPVHVDEVRRIVPDSCPPDFDIVPSLHQLWGVNERFTQAGKDGQAKRAMPNPDAFIKRGDDDGDALMVPC